jgi:hypothetical protein
MVIAIALRPRSHTPDDPFDPPDSRFHPIE